MIYRLIAISVVLSPVLLCAGCGIRTPMVVEEVASCEQVNELDGWICNSPFSVRELMEGEPFVGLSKGRFTEQDPMELLDRTAFFSMKCEWIQPLGQWACSYDSYMDHFLRVKFELILQKKNQEALED